MGFNEKDWVKDHRGYVGRIHEILAGTVTVKYFIPHFKFDYLYYDEADKYLVAIEKDDLIEVLFEEIVDLKDQLETE